MYHDSGRRISGPGCIIYWISGTTTGGIATGSWVQRRGGSLIRATSPDTTRKHPGSLRSGLRQQNRQEISNDPMSKSLPVAAPSPAPVATPQAHSPAATPPPTSISNSPAPTPLPVSRELKNEGYVEMPRKTCGETRAMRDTSLKYVNLHGLLLDHAAVVLNRTTMPSITTPPRKLAGLTDGVCIRPPNTKQCVRCQGVTSCRHLATLSALGVQLSFTGCYLCAGTGIIAIGRERERCQVVAK